MPCRGLLFFGSRDTSDITPSELQRSNIMGEKIFIILLHYL